MINQLILVIMSFILTMVLKPQVEVVGQGFGLAGLLSWMVPTLIVLICVWKIGSDKWNLGDLIASFVLIVLILMYFYQDVSQIFLECSRIMLGACVGAIVAYSAKK
uniref:Multisubunit Na+/H+ antiporter MnhE subunit n=1 Tax=Methanococcus maripaludis (strain C6 / ATCC BAA-1332) TaxID=444158 RepID=A9A7Z7_METM6